MSIMPGATLKLLPENSTQAAITPTQVILHTAVDAPGPTRLDRYFARADVTLESHFWIPLDGEIVQMMDTNVRADANRRANVRAISIETEDEGNPEGIPWTDAQLASLAEIIRWAHRVHGIPMEACPAWDRPGLGFHAMWGAPSPWTPSRGKTCPGSTRIAQFWALIPSLTQEHAMNEAEAARVVETIYAAILHRPADSGGKAFWTAKAVTESWSREDLFFNMLEPSAQEVGSLRSELANLHNDLQTLAQEVEAIGVGLAQANSHAPAEVDVDALADVVGVRLAARLAP